MKNIFKLKNLFTLVAVAALAYGGYYFGTQNTLKRYPQVTKL